MEQNAFKGYVNICTNVCTMKKNITASSPRTGQRDKRLRDICNGQKIDQGKIDP